MFGKGGRIGAYPILELLGLSWEHVETIDTQDVHVDLLSSRLRLLGARSNPASDARRKGGPG
jgi:hypothetical protein